MNELAAPLRKGIKQTSQELPAFGYGGSAVKNSIDEAETENFRFIV